jgi:hypothetical protein
LEGFVAFETLGLFVRFSVDFLVDEFSIVLDDEGSLVVDKALSLLDSREISGYSGGSSESSSGRESMADLGTGFLVVFCKK